jgi:hypothetical protein
MENHQSMTSQVRKRQRYVRRAWLESPAGPVKPTDGLTATSVKDEKSNALASLVAGNV